MMTRSNPNAINSAKYRIPGDSHPPLEAVQDDHLDRYITSTALYLSDQLAADLSGSGTETPTSLSTVSYGWSDATPTGSLTGRSSFCSWGGDVGELDRVACETVRNVFDSIDRVLFEVKPSGNSQVDKECAEWRACFPHLRIEGQHLLDSCDDGTELVDPVIPDSRESDGLSWGHVMEEEPVTMGTGNLEIIGQKVEPNSAPSFCSGEPPLDNPGLHYEEIIAADGVVEEYFAYDASAEERLGPQRASKLKKSRGLPPVTPSACVRDTACSIVFDQIWSEIASVMQPLLRKQTALNGSRSSQMDGVSLSALPAQIPIHEFFLPNIPLDLPPPNRGVSIAQSLKRRPLAPGPLAPGVTTHTTDLPNLQKVMTIKSIPLKQRLPSSSLAPVHNGMLVPLEANSSFIFPDSVSFLSRPFPKLPNSHTPIPPPPQLPTAHTPIPARPPTTHAILSSRPSETNKIISGKIGNRRNPLKPIDIPKPPKTPSMFVLEDDMKDFNGLVGQRLVRHTQLPPLDSSQLAQASRNSGTKGRVTFSTRIVSAASDGGKSHRRLPANSQSELRPSTTNTARAETPVLGSSRRVSNHSVAQGGATTPIKVVGHAANFHTELPVWEEQEEEYPSPPSKPRSSYARGKLSRGHVR